MPLKGMRSIFFKPSSSSSPPIPLNRTFSDPVMEEQTIDSSETIINKWLANSVPSLLCGDRREAKEFFKAVKDLHSAMVILLKKNSGFLQLLRAQKLMQAAMKKVESEFYQILSVCQISDDLDTINRSSTMSDFDEDLFSTESEICETGNSVELVSSMEDLRMISDCMTATGYGKECVKIYKSVRKSIIDEGLFRLGIEKITASQLNKMEWDAVELKIRYWLGGFETAVKTLFYGERNLCERVFSSPTIRESCFRDISTEGAITLFEFPEFVAKLKKTPEKIFRTLDLYEAIAKLWPQIDSIFSYKLSTAVISQVVLSLEKLRESVQKMITDFEEAIQQDNSRSAIRGGRIHPLTKYVMNYLSLLSDYRDILPDMMADWSLNVASSLPESFYESLRSDGGNISPVSVRLAWLVLVLLSKIDAKSELYKDASLSYLFLANNLHYVVSKIRSSNLRFVLGETWVSEHESQVSQYVKNYERMAWSEVMESLPASSTERISPEEAKERFRKFETAFEKAYRKQTSWVVTDAMLRDEMKVSIESKVCPLYRDFYQKFRPVFGYVMSSQAAVKFCPDDLENYFSNLFHGTGVSTDSTSRTSSPITSCSSSNSAHGLH